jgi:hypothetical protein
MEIIQSIVRYELNGTEAQCGSTIIPAGKSVFVVLTDLGITPISNTIEAAATAVYRQFLFQQEPKQVEFYVYCPNDQKLGKETLSHVAMAWDKMLESYVMPEWHQSSMEEFMDLLSSCEYSPDDIPPMSFNS